MIQLLIDIILKAGSVSGLVSLVYLIFQSLRRCPRLKLDCIGGSSETFERDGIQFYRISYSVILRNPSLDPNTVTRLYLAVWENTKKKTSALRFGYGDVTVKVGSTDEQIHLPVAFAPKDAKQLKIIFEFPINGTADERLLQENAIAVPGTTLHKPRHEYEICIEDTSGNLFDGQGKQINRDEINLRWTLPNKIRELQQGRMWPFIHHSLRLAKSRIRFRLKVTGRSLGLWQ